MTDLENELADLLDALEATNAKWLELRAAGKDRTALEEVIDVLRRQSRRVEAKIRKEEKRNV
jgi:hypothetical protein